MFYLSSMDVYFNLPISKITYVHIKNQSFICVYIYVCVCVDNFWNWYIKVDIHVGKVKHKNNCKNNCKQTET